MRIRTNLSELSLVRLGTNTKAAGRHPLQGAHPTCCGVMDKGTAVAGSSPSRNVVRAVEWCRAKLGPGKARALVVNSGNANAFTARPAALDGADGLDRSKAVGCSANECSWLHRRESANRSTPQVDGVLATLATSAGLTIGWALRSDHDHRHLPKVATATVKLARPGSPSTDGKGAA